MSITVRGKSNFELADNLAQFFDLGIDDEPKEDYTALKHKVKDSKLDLEDKNHLINLINSLPTIKNPQEKDKVINEINNMAKKYHLI